MPEVAVNNYNLEKTILQNIANFILSSNRDLGKASRTKLAMEPWDFCSHSCNASGESISSLEVFDI